MKKIIYFLSALALLSVSSCVEESQFNQEQGGEVRTINVVGPESIAFEPVTVMSQTKATIVENGSALKFNWVIGDTLGIFPNKGNQVEFPISAAEGSTSASFDGGGWSLRNNASYAAYYPFSVWNYHRDNETILLDYSGQVQDGNGSYSHLSAYDFLASVHTTPLNGSVTFNMERQGSILYIDIVVPEPETITSLVVSCDESIFVEKASLDISGSSPVVTPVETVETLTLSFTNTATTTANETVRAYMAVQPLDFSDKVVTATLVTESGSYTAPVTSRVVNKGKAAFLRFSDDFTPVNIEFADAEVKRICVENWDTNGDGELSYKEAAAVTDLGTVFEENNTITTFEELQYFTGLSEIGEYAFNYCTELQNVVLPNTIERIGEHAFAGCEKLCDVIFPETLEVIESNAFSFCELIKTIRIPKNVSYIDHTAFYFYCGFTEMVVDEDNQYYCAQNDVLFDKSMTKLICYPPAKPDTYYSVPDGVATIGECAFYSAENLTQIFFPTSLKIIESYAFTFAGFTELKLPDGLLVIGEGAFQACHALTSIHIPASVSEIGRGIGQGVHLQEITVDSANTIYQDIDGVLYDHTGKTLIEYPTGREGTYIVPENVTSISSDAFLQRNNLTEIILNEGLVDISSHAFLNCTGLTEVTIPSSVSSIGSMAFYDCDNLTKINVNIQTPFAISESVFANTNNCPIYVPNESLEAYKTTQGWSAYADRIFGIDVEGSVVGPGVENPD